MGSFLLHPPQARPGEVVKATCLESRRSRVRTPLKLQRNKMFLACSLLKIFIVGSLRDREVAASASERQGSNFKSYV